MIAKGKMTRKQSSKKMEAMVFILNILEEEKQG